MVVHVHVQVLQVPLVIAAVFIFVVVPRSTPLTWRVKWSPGFTVESKSVNPEAVVVFA